MENIEATQKFDLQTQRRVVQRAKDRAKAARWDLDVAIFLFAVLIIIVILLFQGIGIEIVAPVAIFGLAMVWLVGWRRGKKMYEHFYNEETSKVKQELGKMVKGPLKQTIEETIEAKVQKALRERWRGDNLEMKESW